MLGVLYDVYLRLLINNIVLYKFYKEDVKICLEVTHIDETGYKFFGCVSIKKPYNG
jgi:hypothetical protein